MKKTLLTLSMLGAIAVSGSAMAQFADAPVNQGAGAGTKLTISGMLTNTNPNWMWQIPEDTANRATSIQLKTIEGVVNGTNTEWILPAMADQSLLQGYMKTPSATSGAGLTPIITVGSTSILTSTPQNYMLTTDIMKADTTSVAGTLEISLTSSLVAAACYHSTGLCYTTDGSTAIAALNLLKRNQLDYFVTYEGIRIGREHDLNNLELLSQTTSDRFAASGAVDINLRSVKLIVPTASIPNKWTASLPITISMK
ncbi:hypothetical protein [Aliivibrio fischeri]|uniref:F4 family fimbrial subunit n=1 Tax=Aliivibrio fischeri TaxID=668 RepID=UPI00080ED3CF|nr:hypothetical protein [Aliivibrio fischeri]OCH43070.1 hypothetical protein A6D99_00380 [Aliivibrio fischeri]